VPIVGPGTPYITPELLKNASTGIAWSTIPRSGASNPEQLAEQNNMCMRATGDVDGYCNQVLRATADTETVPGPNYRLTINNSTGVARMLLSRWPVTQIVAAQFAPNIPPYQWTTIPANAVVPEVPVIGVYGTSSPSASADGGQAVFIAPGYVNWWNGREGYVVQVSYVNGWPHAGTTGTSAAGDTSLAVDDCTGWTGAMGTIQDGAQQETIFCTTTSVTTGPGTLNLSSPLVNPHTPGIIVTTLPPQVQWAAILFAVEQALERGATATTVQSLNVTAVGEGVKDAADAHSKGCKRLRPFMRTI
jgi:hypothetical protein